MSSRRKGRSKIYVISVGVHLALGLAIAFIPKNKLREVVAIALSESPKPAEKKPEPPKPEAKPHVVRSSGPATVHAAVAQVEANAPVFTDIGLSLDSSSADGLAVNIAPKLEAPKPVVVAQEKPKVLTARPADECRQELVKAKPEVIVQPQYTAEARSSKVEGRVRIELMVDASGAVTSARVLSGLGHGLDESALAAAQRMRFRPATRCGKPVAAPFVLAMRFVLGS